MPELSGEEEKQSHGSNVNSLPNSVTLEKTTCLGNDSEVDEDSTSSCRKSSMSSCSEEMTTNKHLPAEAEPEFGDDKLE